MVAKGASAAKPARDILAAVGIKIDDGRNLILIKTGLNRRLNSGLYYSFVNLLMSNAYSKGKNAANIYKALDKLRIAITGLDKISPF